MIDKILDSCRQLSAVSQEAAEAYAAASDSLSKEVNNQLEANPDIKRLIGGNPLQLMHHNHKNHALFMTTVFRINSFELLARTIPWVYRTYHARGFSYDYFPVQLIAWQIAIHQSLDKPAHKAEILAVYKWMVQRHEDMIKLSFSGEGLYFSVSSEAHAMQEIFLALLLHGDSNGCLTLANQSIHGVDELKLFYLEIVWPAMYRIGQLWESNQITVAEEHLATAIAGRVMTALYTRFAGFSITRGKAIVSACPNEFHELGARMTADFMEMDGWDVTYLGANTPDTELVGILKRHKPFMLALSVSTVFNLDHVQRVIRMVRQEQDIKDIKIMVGGHAFNNMPELWKDIGADGYAANSDSAGKISNNWWFNKK